MTLKMKNDDDKRNVRINEKKWDKNNKKIMLPDVEKIYDFVILNRVIGIDGSSVSLKVYAIVNGFTFSAD